MSFVFLLRGNVAPGRFVTFFYAVIDVGAKHLTSSCAGHNPLIFARKDGTHLQLDAGGPVLGISDDANYEEQTVELSAGDRLLFFTDGVSEAQNSAGEEFGLDRLIHLFRRTQGNAANLKEATAGAVTQFSAGNFHDDVTIVAAILE